MNVTKHMAALIALLLTVNATSALAAVNVDLDFSTLPTTPANGSWQDTFTTANGMVNTGTGIWNVNVGAGGYVWYRRNATATEMDGPYVHGTAEIKSISGLTSTTNNVGVLTAHKSTAGLGANSFYVDLHVRGGAIQFDGGHTGTATITSASIPVANMDGLEHTYGWEIHLPTSTLKVFYDGVQVGTPAGYSIPITAGFSTDGYFFGDGWAQGAHQEEWDRYTVQEGPFVAIPEPACLALASLAGLMLRRRR